MRLLFHIAHSPFARRTRLALAHKGVSVELRDVRAQSEHFTESRGLSPLKTVPVLVEEDGRVIGDSTAICHYLDRAYPSATPLWPADPGEALRVFELTSLVDVALTGAVDYGVRLHALRTADAWPAVKGEGLERIQRALDAVGQRVAALTGPTVCAGGWSAADMWLVTAERWFSSLPERAERVPAAAQVLALGWRLPPELSRWALQHRDRPDVRALEH